MNYAELDECMAQFELAMDDQANADRLSSFMMSHCETFDTEEHLLEHTSMHEVRDRGSTSRSLNICQLR